MRALLWVAAALAVRLACIPWYRIDSDEPQHLHIARNWADGLIPYRDFYDNHFPLFHVLFAPLIGATGESADIIFLGRFAMLPLSAATGALVWMLASRLYDRHAASWAALLAVLFPPLLLKGTEFRSDNLWTVLILATALLVAAGRPLAAGVALGFALVTSIKTAPFAIGIAIAALLVRRRTATRDLLLIAAPAAGVAAIVAGWFARRDALDDLWRCAVVMNGLVDVEAWRRLAGIAVFAVALGGALMLCRRLTAERALIAAIMSIGAGAVFAISPLISARDFLPYFALASIFAAGFLVRRSPAVLRVAPLAFIVSAVIGGDMHRPPDPTPLLRIDQTVQLVEPDETVLDVKGETVFRRRATFITLDRVGREMIERGLVPESIPRDVVRRRCYVATGDLRYFPPATRRFLTSYFVEWGTMRVAGARPYPDGRFTIVIPGHYSVIEADGDPIEPPRYLSAGRHRLRRLIPGAVVIWGGASRVRQRYAYGHDDTRILHQDLPVRAAEVRQRSARASERQARLQASRAQQHRWNDRVVPRPRAAHAR